MKPHKHTKEMLQYFAKFICSVLSICLRNFHFLLFAWHLLFQRRMKATDNYATGLDPLRNAFECFRQDIAGAFAGGDEAKQRLVEQRRTASAYYSRVIYRPDTPGAEVMQGGGRSLHYSSSEAPMRYLIS